ncbi:hypothetical protein [Mesorhizobium sp.]|uniref:hypothetical protein n=1 Tax=Mesorhizobium sp. TaxID=1871066 RepID=UPI000FE6F646|nr:hypothetical protein [Mesorhizobium sp.]RWE37473.1 MAG: hypothetical protein EOS77_02520 [Mesorhizobium sp.]
MEKAKADAVKTALAEAEKRVQEARRMPPWPPECKRHHYSGILLDDGIYVSNVKADTALGDANEQTDACTALYNGWRAAREPKKAAAK